MENSPEIGLAAALEALREELESAWTAAQGRQVRFRASELTLNVETVARRDKDGSGKIRWWLLEAGGSMKSGQERKHTLTLKLMPLFCDDEGRLVSLEVDAVQPVPGG
ncbi:hypothetical protein ELQ39_14425 [Streptomyces sp. GB4-14]|uniref:trypco2 family protein n=1 Tax=Streptomyces sp. GB4-14 TaxID=2498703 RepID=UPI001F5EE9BF|nr:hypothetical protein [Streptomyces sp. GB4-14]